MAEANKPTTTAKVSKRKAGAAKKTKKAKTKLTKQVEVHEVDREQLDTQQAERVLTDRHKRVLEKAKARSTMPAPHEVEEVEAVKITDVSGVVYDVNEWNSMVDMYDSTIKDIKEGEVVTGTVMGVTRDDVIVDVGFKSEGIISIGEFPTPVNIAVGDEIEVFLEEIEDSNGQLILSKQKADFMRVWDKIRDVHDSGDQIQGTVVRRIKGGLVVDVMGVDAFLPGSQVALRQVPDFDALIGQNMDLKIIKINKTRRNIVVSRRIVLEEKRETMRAALLSEIGVGQIRQGVVKNITDFGVFIDLGGVDGLLHITDMSWGRIRHPSEMVNLGEKIDVKILDFDEKTSRISLGLKQMTPYPWENIEQKYPLGRQVTGRVVSITDYGAFVELEKGVEGLIHISEMSWTQHIKHPSKIMNVNDQVEAIVLSVDKENEKISLGIKQMEPDPWATIEDKYPPGQIVSGKVRNLTAFGAFVELEEGIDGLVHISDMSWTKRIQHPSEVMKKGDKVDVKILKIDHENRRISLGYKQLMDDPWPEIAKKYSVGGDCLGTITKVLDRGVVVDLDGDVEGFVPMAQLARKGGEGEEGPKEGDSIPLQVIELDKGQRKVILSEAAYYRKREKGDSEPPKPQPKAEAAPVEDSTPREPERPRLPDPPKTTAMEDAMPAELRALASQVSQPQPEEPKTSEEPPASDKSDSEEKSE
ncbi:MAG TPA: 30S ribosomal protein S1 [candidate division Zixibacteria bacterium]|nr:30S ribosomal protein S1 [candidate division Zixibacteria bacterium]